MDSELTANDVDPITLEVIRHGIVSITDQIDANITRTAFSPYIYEYKDYAVGMTDADGRLIAQCNGGMPVFVADAVGSAVRDGLRVYGHDRLHHGDVLICNAPSVQGQHLNNTVMYTPIYAGAERKLLIGFFAINMHWIDIGGAAVGSASFSSTDIFMEGIQYRTVKIWSNGEPIEEVLRIIEDNTRFPLELTGDIQAQISGCLFGRDLTAQLAEKFGIETYKAAIDLILARCEAAIRDRIRRIPDGVYTGESFLDNDGASDTEIPFKIKVIIEGDDMTVDYSEMAPEVKGCINSGYHGGGVTTARLAFMYAIAFGEPANEGTFRPLKLNLPPGKIVSARRTAAMGNYGMPIPTIVDTIIKALEPVLPERVTGAHFGTYSSVGFVGRRADGTFFNCHDSAHGGWGACATHDGAGPFRTMAHGDTRIIPMELQETLYPYRYEELCLRSDSGGPGRWRGGLGFVKRYRILAECTLRTNLDRTRCPPWGVYGGLPGATGRITVFRNGEKILANKTDKLKLYVGDLVVAEAGGGGGYGLPCQRPISEVMADIRSGVVSRESAERDYGLHFLPDGTAQRGPVAAAKT